MARWSEPIQLISCENGKFILNPTALNNLLKINKPLIVVCIAGVYRTGKSYLMNRLMGQSTGFALGNTIESKTKGIWIWYRSHPKDDNKGLLIMDTEGLDDAMKGDETHDLQILSLSILLSGTFVYNVVGKLDNSVIDRLDFVTEISKHVHLKSNNNSDSDFDSVFPHFVLVCRDKTLELVMDGKQVTADEYMQRVMLTANKRAISPNEIKRNEIKMKLRRYFPQRKCFFFVRPSTTDADMLRLEELTEDKLQPNFITESNKFCSYVIDNSVVKKVTETQPITGKIFVHFAKIYVDAINNDAVPCIGSAINLVSKTENNKLLQECVSKYANPMSELELPLTTDEFEIAHNKNHKIVVEHFAKNVFLDESDEYHEKLQVQLQNEYFVSVKNNYTESDRICNSILNDLFAPIQNKIRTGTYLERGGGGYAKFLQDSDELQREYNSAPKKGALAQAILEKFVLKLQEHQSSILQADKILTKSEQEIEKQRILTEESRLKTEIQREKLKQEEKHQKALIKAHEDQMRALNEAYKEKIEESQRKFEEIMDARLKEQQRLMEEEFNEEAARLRREIEALDAQNQNRGGGIFRSIWNTVGSVLTLVPNPIAKATGLGMNIVGQFI